MSEERVPQDIVQAAYDRSLAENREVTIWKLPELGRYPEHYHQAPTVLGRPREDALCVVTIRVGRR
jgi:hypothetical protein